MTAVVLDTGPLGFASNPRRSPESEACRLWLRGLVARGVRVVVPEIADYELRRELVRAGKASGLRRLEALEAALEYLPITTDAMREAANLWAAARNAGLPTAPREALDGDAILAAQALTMGLPRGEAVVATTNVGHLARFVDARDWTAIA